MPIPAAVMREVVRLKQAMLFDDPGDLGPHIRPDDCRGNLRVVVRREIIADIVNQCRNDQFIVRTCRESPGRRLQRVTESGHRVSEQRMIELRECIEQTIRQTLPEGFQRSEFLLAHGMIDRIVSRLDMKADISLTLSHLMPAMGRSA